MLWNVTELVVFIVFIHVEPSLIDSLDSNSFVRLPLAEVRSVKLDIPDFIEACVDAIEMVAVGLTNRSSLACSFESVSMTYYFSWL